METLQIYANILQMIKQTLLMVHVKRIWVIAGNVLVEYITLWETDGIWV